MSKVLKGRFSNSQLKSGLIEDVIENPEIVDVICICTFKDGTVDVFGDMGIGDLSFGVKIIDAELINPGILNQPD